MRRVALAIVMITFTSAPTLADVDEATHERNFAAAAAFLASHGSSKRNCLQMRSKIKANHISSKLAEDAVKCTEEVREAGSPPEAMNFPAAVADYACKTNGWSSSMCKGLQIFERATRTTP